MPKWTRVFSGELSEVQCPIPGDSSGVTPPPCWILLASWLRETRLSRLHLWPPSKHRGCVSSFRDRQWYSWNISSQGIPPRAAPDRTAWHWADSRGYCGISLGGLSPMQQMTPLTWRAYSSAGSRHTVPGSVEALGSAGHPSSPEDIESPFFPSNSEDGRIASLVPGGSRESCSWSCQSYSGHILESRLTSSSSAPGSSGNHRVWPLWMLQVLLVLLAVWFSTFPSRFYEDHHSSGLI